MTIHNKLAVVPAFGAYLSSRESAAVLRNDLLKCLPAVVDFTGVLVISDSFADEFFAVLVSKHGTDWFAKNVEVIGLTAENRTVVLRAIHHRCECAA